MGSCSLCRYWCPLIHNTWGHTGCVDIRCSQLSYSKQKGSGRQCSHQCSSVIQSKKGRTGCVDIGVASSVTQKAKRVVLVVQTSVQPIYSKQKGAGVDIGVAKGNGAGVDIGVVKGRGAGVDIGVAKGHGVGVDIGVAKGRGAGVDISVASSVI